MLGWGHRGPFLPFSIRVRALDPGLRVLRRAGRRPSCAGGLSFRGGACDGGVGAGRASSLWTCGGLGEGD